MPRSSPSLLSFPLQAALLADRAGLVAHLGVTLHPGWPNPNFAEVLPMFQAWFAEEPSLADWVWFVVVDGQVVGEAGAKRIPDERAAIEIGYGLVPSFRGRGLATAAIEALLGVVEQRGVREVVAEVLETNRASQRVLEKTGFSLVRTDTSEEGPVGWWVWRPGAEGRSLRSNSALAQSTGRSPSAQSR